MKNKHGFTLIELLAVILILGSLIILGSSMFFKTSDNTKGKLNSIMINNIKDAAIMLAQDQKLKDCHNCATYNLNVDCISSNVDKAVEEAACEAKGLSISLATLKQGDYFTDTKNSCYLLDVNNNKVSEDNIIIRVHRYAGNYKVDVGNIFCTN